MVGLACRDCEGDGDVGLADAERAEQGDVGPGVDELQRGEVLDSPGLEVGLERVVELGQGLVVRQAAELQGVSEPALLAQPGLLAEDEAREVEVAELADLRAGDADVGAGELAHRRPCIRAAVASSSSGRT